MLHSLCNTENTHSVTDSESLMTVSSPTYVPVLDEYSKDEDFMGNVIQVYKACIVVARFLTSLYTPPSHTTTLICNDVVVQGLYQIACYTQI